MRTLFHGISYDSIVACLNVGSKLNFAVPLEVKFRSSPNDGEGARGDGEAWPKAQGEVGEAGWEGGLRGPMETDEANAAMDVENVASAPTMSNLEA